MEIAQRVQHGDQVVLDGHLAVAAAARGAERERAGVEDPPRGAAARAVRSAAAAGVMHEMKKKKNSLSSSF